MSPLLLLGWALVLWSGLHAFWIHAEQSGVTAHTTATSPPLVVLAEALAGLVIITFAMVKGVQFRGISAAKEFSRMSYDSVSRTDDFAIFNHRSVRTLS